MDELCLNIFLFILPIKNWGCDWDNLEPQISILMLPIIFCSITYSIYNTSIFILQLSKGKVQEPADLGLSFQIILWARRDVYNDCRHSCLVCSPLSWALQTWSYILHPQSIFIYIEWINYISPKFFLLRFKAISSCSALVKSLMTTEHSCLCS